MNRVEANRSRGSLRPGARFGALQAIMSRPGASWLFHCDACGQDRELRSGKQHRRDHCGCLSMDRRIEKLSTTGGWRGTPEYTAWKNMRQRAKWRTNSPEDRRSYVHVTICERWESFSVFLADVGPRPTDQHSLDRIDPWGSYEPGNVKWSTPTEQRLNQRRQKEAARAPRTATTPTAPLSQSASRSWSRN